MEPPTPKTHRISPRHRWITVFTAPLLSALMIWAAREVIRNHLAGKGTPNIWINGAIVILLGILALVFLLSIVWAFRARAWIRGDDLIVRGLITTRTITGGRVEGYRWINGQLHLYLKDREWPVNISTFEKRAVLSDWVFGHGRDLDKMELGEEDVAISKNINLGITEAEKEERLGRLRGIMKRINLLAYGAAAAGILNWLFIKEDAVEKAAAAVLVSIPVLLDLIALPNRGHVRIDYKEGTRYPQIFTATMVSGVALALMSLFDNTTLLGNAFYRWFVPVAIAKGLIWVWIDADRIRTLRAHGLFVSGMSVVGLIIMPMFWVGGGLYQVNKHFDTSAAVWKTTSVVAKKISRGSRSVSYYIRVTPWNKDSNEPVKLSLSLRQYKRARPGMQADIAIREGALDIPWVSAIRLRQAAVP